MESNENVYLNQENDKHALSSGLLRTANASSWVFASQIGVLEYDATLMDSI